MATIAVGNMTTAEGWDGQTWPDPYLPGKEQAFRLVERDNAELAQLRDQARAPITARRAAFLASRD